MLKYLRIENLILIEQAEIEFGKNLNIITGETGSGKSALLTAIRLLCGEKADPQLIRKEASCAVIVGHIEFPSLDVLAQLCVNEDLDPPESTTASIRRELLVSGKTRIFFNDQQVSISSLRRLLTHAIEMVDQNSAHYLSSNDAQKELLDLWSSLDLSNYQKEYNQQQEIEHEMLACRLQKKTSEETLALARNDLEEIDAVAWQKEEESKLSLEHDKLSHVEQLTENLNAALRDISGGSPTIPTLLSHLSSSLEGYSFDQSLKEAASLLKNAALETLDAERIVQRSLMQLEIDPERLNWVEKRIGAIERIKRRFGASFEAVQEERQKRLNQINDYERLDEKLSALEKTHQTLSANIYKKAQEISNQRRQSASLLQNQIVNELVTLNLPHARFEIRITEKPLSADGLDAVSFYFSANPGQSPLLLKECASGGEQSRLLLAIKVLMAQKDCCPCLIFDEIDSNVGGQTASIVGQKLQLLSKNRQVICVTHFVQVAQFAMHHFLVSKLTDQKQAHTIVQKLDHDQCELEYRRMVGLLKIK